jgi:TolB-like protein/class 3 adenylate cyclase/tetratricopeptide (TPR) repeat protein
MGNLMTAEEVKRKLTAILSADVEGYSRLMGEDEVGTIRTLTAYRDAMTGLILLNCGRVVDAPGDNLLAEFASVVDAVQCAVEIQRELAERNAELPEERKMQFRIGVNLGDVVEEKDRIYGDGVNIAARMESLCGAGGVCISGTAFEHVENKLDLEFEDLGEHEVKNIAKPVRVYRVLSYPGAAAHRVIKAKKVEGKKWRKISFAIAALLVIVIVAGILWNFYFRQGSLIEVASVEKMAFPLPDKPSIAVLPFINMSDDPEQEYFSDGITEDIITDLSKISGLFVISRSSTFAYKGKAVKTRQVAQELGVRYVLEGSVRKGSDKIRINAQLVDAITGHHLWAERYDRDMNDIFALQGEITQKIVMTLQVEVREAELERIRRIPTENLNAYETLLRGVGYLGDRRKSTNAQARQMFERAIELDPGYAGPYLGMSVTYYREWLYSWTSDPQTMKRAFELAQKAINRDDSDASAYRVLSMIYLWKDRQHEQAIAAAEKAIALDPNNASGYTALAETVKFAGRPEEVIKLMETAMRLNPRYPAYYLFQSGSSYYYIGRYEEALALLKRAVTRMPNHMPTHQYLAAIYTELGRKEEAQAELAEILRISPNHSLNGMARYPYKDPAYLERLRDHLRKAGLK